MHGSETYTPQVPLWKFLSLAEGQNPTWQDKLDTLLSGKAYLSSPEDFNDPFDCLPNFATPNELSEIPGFISRLSDKISQAVESFTPKQVQEKLNENLKNIGPKEFGILIKKSIFETSGGLGVFCLTEAIDNVLMWSHYASNHRGVAVAFRLDLLKKTGLNPIERIRYQSDRPSVDIMSGDEHDHGIGKLLAVKAKFWEYEREWRCIRPKASRTFISYNSSIIDRIVFGVKCSIQDKESIITKCKGKDLHFFDACATSNSFEIRFREIAR